MIMRNGFRNSAFSGLLTGVALVLSGCGSGSVTASSSGVQLTGSLSTSGGGSSKIVNHAQTAALVGARTVSYEGDSVVCATLSDPPVTATASVKSNGSFTITIDGGVNQPMNCNLVDSSGNILAAIVTSDSAHTDMNGNPTTQSTVAFTASADLGSISYDPATGKATVPVENIQAAVAPTPSASDVYDPSGEWTIAAVPYDLPKGYSALCPQNSQNCNGPPAGQLISLKQYRGVLSSDETTPVFGLQIWQGGEASRLACGTSIGMTHAEALAVGVDFSSTGAEGSFTYASNVTINGTSHALTNDYQIAGASSQYSFQLGCGSQTITVGGVSQLGWVCTGTAMDHSTTLYQASAGGGCVSAATNKPVEINGSWTIDSGPNPCSSVDLGGGFSLQTCHGTYNSEAVVCTNEFGVFTSSSLSSASAVVGSSSSTQFDWSSLTQIAQGTACNDASFSGHALQQAQCYVQYFQQNVDEHGSACLKRIDTDWSASTVANFIRKGNNPRSLVAFNEFHPDPSGKGGAMRMEQTQIQGIQSASGHGYTPCNTFEVDEFSYKKVDNKTLLATYQSTTIATDTSKPDCVAHFGSAGNGSVQKFVFYLKK